MKYLFSTKIWFVKTSTRIVKYEPRVVKLNPGYVSSITENIMEQHEYYSYGVRNNGKRFRKM